MLRDRVGQEGGDSLAGLERRPGDSRVGEGGGTPAIVITQPGGLHSLYSPPPTASNSTHTQSSTPSSYEQGLLNYRESINWRRVVSALR